MTYAQRHRNDKSLKGERSPRGSAKSPRIMDKSGDPSGMVHKPVDGLEWNKMIDFEEPKSSDKLPNPKN